MEWKHTGSPVNKKVVGAAVSKERDADSLLGHEGTINIEFLEKKCCNSFHKIHHI